MGKHEDFPASVPAPASRMLRTIDGATFDGAPDVWAIPTASGSASFNFTNLPGASERLREGIKDALGAMLLSVAPERAMRALSGYRVLLRHITTSNDGQPIVEIRLSDVENFGTSLAKRQRYQLRQLRDHLMTWAATGAYGLATDLRRALPKLDTEAHEVGAAVRTMNPNTGPLTDIEYEAVIAAMRQGFSTGDFALADYALMVLALALGARPLQLAMMKARDFSDTPRQDGSRIYILQVTRLKQGKGIRPRTLFRPRELSSGVGVLVRRQCAAARQWAVETGIDPDEAPIFPCIDNKPGPRKLAHIGLEGHFAGKGLGAKLSRLFTRLAVRSHRTGEDMRVFQTRLRRTLGTRAAAEGLSAAVIADLLDHSWVDSSLVYIEGRAAMIERIDKALALKIAPLAQAFSGTLVRREETLNPVKPGSRIIHIETEEALEAVGGCGKFQFCGLAAPLACYTCCYFRPWLDAPHEELLEHLLAEREEVLQISDLRIASVNDRTILAVADVVNRCRDAAKGIAA